MQDEWDEPPENFEPDYATHEVDVERAEQAAWYHAAPFTMGTESSLAALAEAGDEEAAWDLGNLELARKNRRTTTIPVAIEAGDDDLLSIFPEIMMRRRYEAGGWPQMHRSFLAEILEWDRECYFHPEGVTEECECGHHPDCDRHSNAETCDCDPDRDCCCNWECAGYHDDDCPFSVECAANLQVIAEELHQRDPTFMVRLRTLGATPEVVAEANAILHPEAPKVQRAGPLRQPICTVRRRIGARARGAGRPRAQASRSSARSGDSGDDDGPSPPPPELRLWRHPHHGPFSPNLLRVLLAVEREEAGR